MKIAVIIVRTLMGLLFLFGSVAILFNLAPQPELTGNMKTYMDGILASGYLLTLVKVTELVCGLSFLTGRFVPLATILISPVIVNIFLTHLFLEPKDLPMSILLILGNAFLAYANWEKFKPLLEAK